MTQSQSQSQSPDPDPDQSSITTTNPENPDSHISTPTSLAYWSRIPPTVNGMLGGYPQISTTDLRGSHRFLAKLRRLSSPPTTTTGTATTTSTTTDNASGSATAPQRLLRRGVDCGAGIGRVTTGFLSQVCETVDVVEPVAQFASVLADSDLKRAGKVGEVYVVGLQDWDPAAPDTPSSTVALASKASPIPTPTSTVSPTVDAPGRKNDYDHHRYDLIWNQWCVGHLTDAQLVAYLRRCGAAVNPSGWIVVKENLSTHRFGEDIFDEVDSSVTRSDGKFRQLFREAGLSVVKAELQTGFPRGLGLFPVKMYALRPT